MFRRGLVTVSKGKRSIEWSKLLTLAQTPEKKQHFNKLKNEYENLASAVTKAKKKKDVIDWSHYSTAIQTPGIAEELKKEFEHISYHLYVPPVDTSSYDESVTEAQQIKDEAVSKVKELEERLAFLETRRVTKDTTIEEFLTWYPDIAKEVDEEHAKGEYFKSVV